MAANYQLELERALRTLEGTTPRLLLHCCCAPCASYVLEYLAPRFAVTAYYYNPNIDTAHEHAHRAEELARLVREMPLPGAPDVRAEPYAPEEFYAAVKGLEKLPEGGERCRACYRLRLARAAQAAAAGGYDFFTTTLSISPHKNAAWLNELGQAMAERYGVRWLPSDFKKKNGFGRSTQLAAQYGLYRQDYCGCVFSRREAGARKAANRAAAPEPPSAPECETAGR